MLVQQGMQAEIAADGDAALELIAAAPPDLVLLDVQMPGPNGFEICRELKGQGRAMLKLPGVTVAGTAPFLVEGHVRLTPPTHAPLMRSSLRSTAGQLDQSIMVEC